MKNRDYDLTKPGRVEGTRPPPGGGLYLVTAGRSGRVIYVGRSLAFRRRGYRRHHRRAEWFRCCGPSDVPYIRFVSMTPSLSRTQLGDIEAKLIHRSRPDCNRQHNPTGQKTSGKLSAFPVPTRDIQ